MSSKSSSIFAGFLLLLTISTSYADNAVCSLHGQGHVVMTDGITRYTMSGLGLSRVFSTPGLEVQCELTPSNTPGFAHASSCRFLIGAANSSCKVDIVHSVGGRVAVWGQEIATESLNEFVSTNVDPSLGVAVRPIDKQTIYIELTLPGSKFILVESAMNSLTITTSNVDSCSGACGTCQGAQYPPSDDVIAVDSVRAIREQQRCGLSSSPVTTTSVPVSAYKTFAVQSLSASSFESSASRDQAVSDCSDQDQARLKGDQLFAGFVDTCVTDLGSGQGGMAKATMDSFIRLVENKQRAIIVGKLIQESAATKVCAACMAVQWERPINTSAIFSRKTNGANKLYELAGGKGAHHQGQRSPLTNQNTIKPLYLHELKGSPANLSGSPPSDSSLTSSPPSSLAFPVTTPAPSSLNIAGFPGAPSSNPMATTSPLPTDQPSPPVIPPPAFTVSPSILDTPAPISFSSQPTTSPSSSPDRLHPINYAWSLPPYTTYPTTAPIGTSSAPTTAPIGTSSAPTTAPIGTSSAPTTAPVGTPSAPTTAPIGTSSAPTTAPIGTSSAPTTAPIGTSSAPTTAPIGTSSAPTTAPIGTSSAPTPYPMGTTTTPTTSPIGTSSAPTTDPSSAPNNTMTRPNGSFADASTVTPLKNVTTSTPNGTFADAATVTPLKNIPTSTPNGTFADAATVAPLKNTPTSTPNGTFADAATVTPLKNIPTSTPNGTFADAATVTPLKNITTPTPNGTFADAATVPPLKNITTSTPNGSFADASTVSPLKNTTTPTPETNTTTAVPTSKNTSTVLPTSTPTSSPTNGSFADASTVQPVKNTTTPPIQSSVVTPSPMVLTTAPLSPFVPTTLPGPMYTTLPRYENRVTLPPTGRGAVYGCQCNLPAVRLSDSLGKLQYAIDSFLIDALAKSVREGKEHDLLTVIACDLGGDAGKVLGISSSQAENQCRLCGNNPVSPGSKGNGFAQNGEVIGASKPYASSSSNGFAPKGDVTGVSGSVAPLSNGNHINGDRPSHPVSQRSPAQRTYLSQKYAGAGPY